MFIRREDEVGKEHIFVPTEHKMLSEKKRYNVNKKFPKEIQIEQKKSFKQGTIVKDHL